MVGWFPGCWRKKAAAKKVKYVGSLLGSFFSLGRQVRCR